VVIGANQFASYWYSNPGELESIQDAWTEAGVANRYSGNFVSGSIVAAGVEVIVYGRSRAGSTYGHGGFTDWNTRWKTRTDTSRSVSRVVGISGDITSEHVQSYDNKGDWASMVVAQEGVMDGVTWLDETSGTVLAGSGHYYPYVIDTNTERRSIGPSMPIDPEGNGVIRFDYPGGNGGISGRVIATTEDSASAPTVFGADFNTYVRSATIAPPVTANAGQSVHLASVRVTRQP
jgi:hypothetical protein